jgi:hypothetical protein
MHTLLAHRSTVKFLKLTGSNLGNEVSLTGGGKRALRAPRQRAGGFVSDTARSTWYI